MVGIPSCTHITIFSAKLQKKIMELIEFAIVGELKQQEVNKANVVQTLEHLWRNQHEKPMRIRKEK